MRDFYWTKKRLQRYEKLKKDGDLEGLRRMQFGSYIARMRSLISADFSQKKAAKEAQITRIQWNRIENGHVLPRPTNIPDIAYTVNAEPVDLFKMAGYTIPLKHSVYDRKGAHKKMDYALNSSKSLLEFLRYMAYVWREYEFEQLRVPLEVSFSCPEPKSAKADILARILSDLAPRDILKLARELVQICPRGTPGLGDLDIMRFYDEIDTRLSELKY